MAEIPLYCSCGQAYDPERFMIQCDSCKDWFHGSCVGVKEYLAVDIDKFYCNACESRSGPTIYKPRMNWHRHDPSDGDAREKPVQAGTAAFVKELKNRHFRNGDEVIVRLRGQQLTLPYLHSNGFTQPILVEGKDGLGLHVPQNFTVQDVENYVGSERMMDVVDVTRQADIRMSLHDYVEYYTDPSRSKIFNVISLEFSDSHLSALVEAPYIARKLCWVNNHWPRDSNVARPEVQKYCLMSVKDSYTDFHIDFGGSSVWYHVLKGEKVFYFVPPTPAHLAAYKRWMASSSMHETFLGDVVDGACYRVALHQGQTLLIPTGWIHAVFTPVDSLVFGGNFLHSLNIALQLDVYEIEKATKAPDRFRFPYFETLHWLAAERLVQDLHDLNGQGGRCPDHLVAGARALLAALKAWAVDKENTKSRSLQTAIEPVPERINVPRLLKDLARELRNAERNSNPSASASAVEAAPASASKRSSDAAAAVKKEREASKRVRRKPKARADFVDINEALSNFAAEEERLAMNWSPAQSQGDVGGGQRTAPLKLLLPKKSRGGGVVVVRANDRAVDDDDDDQDVDEDAPLMIDERQVKPKSKSKKEAAAPPPRGSLKIRLSVSGRSSDFQLAETTEVAAHMDVVTPAADDGDDDDDNKNGIEHLLRASSMAAPAEPLEDLVGGKNNGRTSPSTREAIVGMLSMSRGFDAATSSASVSTPSTPTSASQRRRKGRRRPPVSGFGPTDDDVISKVHQDDDYIYPSLDASDDEMQADMDEPSRGGRGLQSGDESWNPRARVGPVVPKTDRPVREGARRPAVERVLEAAAQKRALEPPAKRPYQRRKKVSKDDAGWTPPASAAASKNFAGPGFSPPPPPASAPPSASGPQTPSAKTDHRVAAVKKPKKGMATAKQRLGKILKIHKMAYQ